MATNKRKVMLPHTMGQQGIDLIKAREDSWVSITADGQPVMQDTLTSAAEKSVPAHNQIVIKTGNVGALDISFNVKKLAPQGRDNQVKTLTFDLNGLRP